MHSRAAASGAGLPPDDAFALLETVLFVAARASGPRSAAAASWGFRYLLAVAQAGGDGANAQVRCVSSFRLRIYRDSVLLETPCDVACSIVHWIGYCQHPLSLALRTCMQLA